MRIGELPWIATYSFALGAVFTACTFSAIILYHQSQTVNFSNICWWSLLAYGACLTVFHQMEFVMTAIYHPHKLSLDSYLLNHSPEYTAAHVSALAEYLVEAWMLAGWKTAGPSLLWLQLIGLLLTIVGQVMRSGAMWTAGNNFTHVIATRKADSHKLVTSGIYAYVRHPSYLGFCLWALGSQMMLLNPLCFIGFSVVLYGYFKDRIQWEERLLVDFFGDDYRKYQRSVWSGIPFI